MKNKKDNFFQELISSPIFFLIAIIIVFAGLIYFSGSEKKNSLNSTYSGNENWENVEAVRGNENALITIVEYGDYQCPACANVLGMVEQVLEEYKNQVKFVYRHFPLPGHKFAQKASVTAECAGEQGKFWEMHETLFENQKNLNDGSLKKYAEERGLDMGKFNICFENNGYIDKINNQKIQGEKDNVLGTPAFFIEGRAIENAENENYIPTFNDFKREIDAELKKVEK